MIIVNLNLTDRTVMLERKNLLNSLRTVISDVIKSVTDKTVISLFI